MRKSKDLMASRGKNKNRDLDREDDRLLQAAKVSGGIAIRVIVIAVLIGAFYYGARTAYNYGYELFSDRAASPAPGRDVTVVLEEGATHDDVAAIFYKKGLVRDVTATKILLRIYTNSKFDIKPGEYVLNTSMTTRQLIEAVSGEIAAGVKAPEHLGLYDEPASESQSGPAAGK